MVEVAYNSTGSFILSSQYPSGKSVHVDQFYCGGVNLWRDVFSKEQLGRIIDRSIGDTINFEQNYKIAPYDDSLRRHVLWSHWIPPQNQLQPLQPRLGRWYPAGFVRSLPGAFTQSHCPNRSYIAMCHI